MNRMQALLGVGLLVAAPAVFAAGDVEAGKGTFEAKCQACHQVGPDGQDTVGPALHDVKSGKLPSGDDATEENLMKVINDGKGSMPKFGSLLEDDEKVNLVAYVMSL